MKKIIVLCILCLFISGGCKDKKIEDNPLDDINEDENIEDKVPDYVDDNPIKLSLYEYNGSNAFNKKSEYYSPMSAYKEIGLFSVIYTDEDVVNGYSIKNLWNEYSNNYENVSNYKLGYEISFTLKDGREFQETILKPLDVFHYSFWEYVYVWVYDDINQTADWYSHLEEDEYNEKTIMSSIKLMSTELTGDLATPINLTAFTYKDENDFDENGKYRGNSKFTLLINKN